MTAIAYAFDPDLVDDVFGPAVRRHLGGSLTGTMSTADEAIRFAAAIGHRAWALAVELECVTSVDLSGARGEFNLSRYRFAGMRLRRLRLSGSVLSDCDFEGADLSGADLSNSCLTGCNFTKAILTGANLTGADVSWSTFDRTVMTRTDLRRASALDVALSPSKAEGLALDGSILTGAVDVSTLAGCAAYRLRTFHTREHA